ncbi:hypothetical protein ABZP36_017023 [Zizania latifolia]
MGKKRGDRVPAAVGAARSGSQAVSLREESSGKTRADAASLLRLQHLQRLAAWAGGEAGVGPVGALLGRRLAGDAEAAGVPLGASTFVCQRCETVLQPGFNCTIHIKNNKRKAKRRKKLNCCQNSISYSCHFCGDENLIRGSAKNILKGLLSSRKPVSTDSTSIKLKGDSRNKRLVTIKEGLDHFQAAASQLESSSGLKRSSVEKNENEEMPIPNLLNDSMEGVVSSSVELNQSTTATEQEDISQKIVVSSTVGKCIQETESVSAVKIKVCESDVLLKAEFPVGSTFVTPQKRKLMDVMDPKDSAELLETRSIQNKKGERSGSVNGKAPTPSTKCAPNASGKNNKPVASGSAQMSGSSRKRARKGWTTLKQIAEKEELERKEKMGNFVIPFFMQ